MIFEMEQQLYKFVFAKKDHFSKIKTMKEIENIVKKKALQLTNFPDSFKASKDWFDRFC